MSGWHSGRISVCHTGDSGFEYSNHFKIILFLSVNSLISENIVVFNVKDHFLEAGYIPFKISQDTDRPWHSLVHVWCYICLTYWRFEGSTLSSVVFVVIALCRVKWLYFSNLVRADISLLLLLLCLITLSSKWNSFSGLSPLCQSLSLRANMWGNKLSDDKLFFFTLKLNELFYKTFNWGDDVWSFCFSMRLWCVVYLMGFD